MEQGSDFSGWDPEAVPERRIRLSVENQGSRHSLTLRPWVLASLILLALGGLLYVGLFAFRAAPKVNSTQQKKLEQENRQLRQLLQKYSAELDSISVRLDTLKVPAVDEETIYPYIGGGGPSGGGTLPDNPELAELLIRIANNVTKLKLRLGFDLTYAIPRFELPAGFTRRGDGIPSIYPTFGTQSSGWGLRIHPLTAELEFHTGLDIANKVGTPVYATADGVVAKAHQESGFGRMITIAHAGGYVSLYGHLSQLKVHSGDAVHKGQIIALMGNTGLSTGPHLHYGVSRNGEPVNPSSYLNRIDSGAYTSR